MVTWPSGSVTEVNPPLAQYQYDARGNRTAVIDALGNQTSFVYDARNRLTTISYPTTPATTTTFAYDTRGRRTSVTDQNGKVTSYAYDDADRLTSVTDAAGNVTSYAYDTENNLTGITDALGRVTSFSYDPLRRVTQTTFPSTLSEAYAYDAAGNLISRTDRKGQTINYNYDALDRLITKSYPDSTAVNYIYDDANRMTQVADPTGTYSFTYDNMGRLTGTSTQYAFLTAPAFTMAYGYDQVSNRTSMTNPQSGVTSYLYDTLNRLQRLTNPQSIGFVLSYDALGRRTQITRPQGYFTNYTYDTLSRLLSIAHTPGRGRPPIGAYAYTYDAAGNRTSKTPSENPSLGTATESYTYDALYQLTQVAQGANTIESYSYDAVGNRLSSLGVSPYSYNGSNQLTSTPGVSYSYDNNGNTLTKTDSNGTTSYAWDFENRLRSVTLPGTGGTVTFKYDPFGRRIQKSGPSGTTNYLYDGANILEELDGGGNLVARFTQGPGIDEPLIITTGGGSNYYYFPDALGSIMAMTDSAVSVDTFTYGAFGTITPASQPFSPPAADPYRYTGREFDAETGLYYYRARYYDPQVGRFIAEDPAGFGGGTNKFTYALDNPAVFKDPLGLDTVVIFVWDNPINHAAVYIDDGGPLFDSSSVIYDPGGSWGHDKGCGSGDACTGASLDDYVNYYKRNYPGSKVDLIRFPTTPEEEAQIAARIHRGGGSPGYCAIDTGAVLRGIGPFKDLGKAYLPGGLRDEVLKAHDSLEVLSRNVLRRLTPRPPDSALWPRY